MRNARRSRGVLPPVARIRRFALGVRLIALDCQGPGRSGVMVAAAPTARARPISARLAAGVAPEVLSPGSPREATMAGRAEARTAVVAGADRRLAEAASSLPTKACRYRTKRSIEVSLFRPRGVLKKQLMAHLRTARQMRQAKGGNTKSGAGTDRRYCLHPRTAGRG